MWSQTLPLQSSQTRPGACCSVTVHPANNLTHYFQRLLEQRGQEWSLSLSALCRAHATAPKIGPSLTQLRPHVRPLSQPPNVLRIGINTRP